MTLKHVEQFQASMWLPTRDNVWFISVYLSLSVLYKDNFPKWPVLVV